MAEHLTAARRPGRLLLVAGEAGAGKTALVDAFCREHVPDETLWGTCDGIVPSRPFAPLADIAARSGGPLRAALEKGDRRADGRAMTIEPRRQMVQTDSRGSLSRAVASLVTSCCL